MEDCSHTGCFWGWDFASCAPSDQLCVLRFCHLNWRGRENKPCVMCRIFCTCPLESSTEIRGSNLAMTNLQIPVLLLNEGAGQIPRSLCVSPSFHRSCQVSGSQQLGLYEEKAWKCLPDFHLFFYITEGETLQKESLWLNDQTEWCFAPLRIWDSVTGGLRMWVLDHRGEKTHKGWTFHFVWLISA